MGVSRDGRLQTEARLSPPSIDRSIARSHRVIHERGEKGVHVQVHHPRLPRLRRLEPRRAHPGFTRAGTFVQRGHAGEVQRRFTGRQPGVAVSTRGVIEGRCDRRPGERGDEDRHDGETSSVARHPGRRLRSPPAPRRVPMNRSPTTERGSLLRSRVTSCPSSPSFSL